MPELMIYFRSVQTSKLFFNIFMLMMAFFMMKLGQFVLMPFLAIYLSHYSLSPVLIGIIIASGQLCHSITSLFTGHLADRYNPKQLFMITLFGSGIAYESLYESQTLICFILLNALLGILRAVSETASKTLLATNTNEQQRNFVFGLRYVVLNLAAALGPLVGTRYAAGNSMQLFHVIAYCYFFTSLLLLIFWSKNRGLQTTEDSYHAKNISAMDTLRLIAAHSALKKLFFISFICYALYSQITFSLAQYIVEQFDDGVELYSNLLILNAVICVLLPIFIGPLIQKINYILLASIGLSLLALGFCGFCFAQTKLMLNGSMLVLSVGEVIFFPLNDVLLAKIAPPQVMGSYYGVLNASTIGLAAGPVLGGAIYQVGNYYSLFLICSLASLLTIFLYRKLVVLA